MSRETSSHHTISPCHVTRAAFKIGDSLHEEASSWSSWGNHRDINQGQSRLLVWCVSGNVDDKLRNYSDERLRLRLLFTTEQPLSSGAELTMDVFNKQAPIVQRPSVHILGQLNPFIHRGPYIMILNWTGKLMIRLYLETFQHYKALDSDSLDWSSGPSQTLSPLDYQGQKVINPDLCWIENWLL